MPNGRGSRTDQYIVTLTLDGVSLGVWDKLTGGDVDSNEVKYGGGGMKTQVALGGRVTVSDLTVSRIYDLDRDAPIIARLMPRVGKGDMVASQQPLDTDGNPKGNPTVYTGVLKTCKTPDVDSEAASAAVFDVVISADGQVTA